MSKEIRIKIKKLFRVCDMDLAFNNNLNIIAGENGCGKSTIMKIMDNIINNDFIELVKIPFDTIELCIGKVSENITFSELEQLEISKNPEFRFAVRESLEETSSFDDFIKRIFQKSEKFKKYSFSYDDNEYASFPDKYLVDDDKIFGIKNYMSKMKKTRCIYGSKLYLRQVYNIYHNEFARLIEFKEIQYSYLYSFINLDVEFYKFRNINILDKHRVLKVLKKMMPKKIFKFKHDVLYIYNKKNNVQISYEKLSSGEKKIIQFYKSICSLNKKSLLLLDEPELSLSYKWSENLLSILKLHSKKTKIIIATQQPSIDNERDLELLVPILFHDN